MICRLRRGENRTNRKVFGQAFFKKLAGDKRGRRPLLCSAARGAVRNAKQKKAVPAKNSEAIFWRPRFTWPLRAGKRANANFACSEGFFCARRAAPFARAGRFFEACRCLACWLLCLVFRRFFCRCSAALFPACGLSAVFCLACAACLPFGRRRLCFRLAGSLPLLCKLLRPLPCLPAVRFVCAFSSCFGCLFARSVLCARLFSLIFRLFLPDFCLSNLFSFVAQAATGLYFLPKRK